MSLLSKKVFLAPSVFLAFIDRVDPKYNQADAFFRYFAQEEYHLFTDLLSVNNIYEEIYNEISQSLGKDFLRALSVSNINILYPEEGDMKAALKTLITYQSNELTFDEALMAVLAVKRGINQIASFNYLHALFGLTLFYIPI